MYDQFTEKWDNFIPIYDFRGPDLNIVLLLYNSRVACPQVCHCLVGGWTVGRVTSARLQSGYITPGHRPPCQILGLYKIPEPVKRHLVCKWKCHGIFVFAVCPVHRRPSIILYRVIILDCTFNQKIKSRGRLKPTSSKKKEKRGIAVSRCQMADRQQYKTDCNFAHFCQAQPQLNSTQLNSTQHKLRSLALLSSTCLLKSPN